MLIYVSCLKKSDHVFGNITLAEELRNFFTTHVNISHFIVL
jgi:hypothetical protein